MKENKEYVNDDCGLSIKRVFRIVIPTAVGIDNNTKVFLYFHPSLRYFLDTKVACTSEAMFLPV